MLDFCAKTNLPVGDVTRLPLYGTGPAPFLPLARKGLLVAFLWLVFAHNGSAIPVFARLYRTSCSTCHLDFPKLNDFGKAFKDAGFKFPVDDQETLKIPPVMLGAEANKENFPESIWPGSIPGLPPIGLRMNSYFQLTRNASRYNAFSSAGTVAPLIPSTDFQTGFFSLFSAGNLGGDIAWWVDDDLSVSGDNAAGGLGDAYLKFVNIGRLVRLPKDLVTVRFGQFELDLPFTQARTINISPYDIYLQTNIGAMNPLAGSQQYVANTFSLADPARGIEISGGHSYGGYHYSFAVVDQNTSGVSQSSNTFPFLPSATGGAGGGIGFASDSGLKNIYARVSYRFNLERDAENRRAIRAAGATGPHDHTYLNLGAFSYSGKSEQRLVGALSDGGSTILTAREPFYRLGGDFSFNYRTFNLFGLYMVAHDRNLLPVDSAGNLILLPLGPNSNVPVGFVEGTPAKYNGGFVEADYLFLPWIMAIMRWDTVHSSADRINGLEASTATPFFAPYSATRNRFTPGIQFLIRPNVKASMEYQFRPQQVAASVDPATGQIQIQKPFRVNTTVFGLEWVY